MVVLVCVRADVNLGFVGPVLVVLLVLTVLTVLVVLLVSVELGVYYVCGVVQYG